MLSVDRHLNLVIPIERDDETALYVHSTPIRPETFAKYHLVIAKTFSAFAQHGLDPRSGPSVAAHVMKDVALNTGRSLGSNWWDGVDGIGGESGLLAEMVRLSNVVTPRAKGEGWGTIPLQAAFEQSLVSAEEKQEVLNLLTFFIVVSAVAPRADRQVLIKGMSAIYGLQTTFSNSTDFANSLTTQTPEEPIGESPTAS